MKIQHILCSALWTFALLIPLQAQIPKTIGYQGVLTDAAGNPSDGNYNFTFAIYDAQTGGTALWTESSKSLVVAGGLFNTALGDQTPFPATLTFDQPYWLDIQVSGEQLSDRVALLSVPYSIRAAQSDTALFLISESASNPTLELWAKFIGINAPDFSAMRLTQTGGTMPTLDVENNGSGISIRIDHSNSTDDPGIELSYSGSGDGIFVESTNSSNSEAGIKVTYVGTGYAGHFIGDVLADAHLTPSDARLKRDITTIDNALASIQSLRGVQFQWNRKEYPERNFKSGKQHGLIAQEVEAVLPDLVSEDKDGFKSVDYQRITAFLVESIKQQQQQIEELKAAVAALQAQSDIALQD